MRRIAVEGMQDNACRAGGFLPLSVRIGMEMAAA
jgi:hypothetical protein